MAKTITIIELCGEEYKFFRSLKGRNTDKFNRSVKLAYRFDELSEKFDGMIERGRNTSDNARLALACKLMMYTGIRIGNEGSSEGYVTQPHPNSSKEPEFVQTYGLTTLLREHVEVKRGVVYLHFLGKKQVENSFKLDKTLSKQVRALLNEYEAETIFDITAYELTKFVKKYVGASFTPKDFRTLRANIVAWDAVKDILERELPTTKKQRREEVKEVATYVSEHLNNTPSVCKVSYIDSALWDYLEELRQLQPKKR
nr:MAG TPA: DNA topoisomerase 1 [Caudoviricetes sp.]